MSYAKFCLLKFKSGHSDISIDNVLWVNSFCDTGLQHNWVICIQSLNLAGAGEVM